MTTIPPPPNFPPDIIVTPEMAADSATLKALDAELVATIAAKTLADKTGSPDEKQAARAAYEQAHAKRWDFAKQMSLRAVGARDAQGAEMQVLELVVRETLSQARPDVLFLHNNLLPAPIAAARMFSHLGAAWEMYRRGNSVVELDRENGMSIITPAAFRSRLNKKGRRVIAFEKKQGQIFYDSKLCSDDEARVLLSTFEVNLLPEIKLVVSMPVLVEGEVGELKITVSGYNADCGILVTGNTALRDVPVGEAVAALLSLFKDVIFATDGDKSRAVSGIIGPAIRMGGLLGKTNALV